MISPIHGLYDRPNISVALFVSDHLQLTALTTVRFAWLLALSKLTVVAFFAVFLVFITRAAIRKSGGCDEALAMALGIGSLISFASMVMASQVGESAALRLHATELLLLLGTRSSWSSNVRPAAADGGVTCGGLYPFSSPSS